MNSNYMIDEGVSGFIPSMAEDKIVFKDFNLWYGGNHVLKDTNISIKNNIVTAFMGPSGCGKSTLLRSIDRMNDIIPICRTEGEVHLDGRDIYKPEEDVYELRKRVGMVFQKPNPFPMSLYDNIAYGPKLHKLANGDKLDKIVEESLKGAEQRLCIARALSISPDIILMDEPCSALDPIATMKIEALMRELKENYTVVLVTHNLQQAARVSEMTAFMYIGEVVEFDSTRDIFENPQNELTENYITGKFG